MMSPGWPQRLEPPFNFQKRPRWSRYGVSRQDLSNVRSSLWLFIYVHRFDGGHHRGSDERFDAAFIRFFLLSLLRLHRFKRRFDLARALTQRINLVTSLDTFQRSLLCEAPIAAKTGDSSFVAIQSYGVGCGAASMPGILQPFSGTRVPTGPTIMLRRSGK
jgi:hypothetical protein